MNLHSLKTSIVVEGGSTTTGGSIRFDARETTSIANAVLPKYTTSILFFDVSAYILRKNQVSQ